MSVPAATSANTAPVPAETGPFADDEEALRKEAIASVERKRKFGRDLFAYVTVNGVLWVIWALSDRTSDGSMPWPAWVSAIWAFFLAIDAWRAFVRRPRSLFTPTTQAEIEREMRRHKPGG